MSHNQKPVKFSKAELKSISKDFDPSKQTAAQIESLLKENEQSQQTLIAEGNYPEAGKVQKKVDMLKIILKQKKIEEVKNRHYREKTNLRQGKKMDMDSKENGWALKFKDLQSRSKAAVDELKKQHEKELQDLYVKFENKAKNNIKPSLNYLKLQKEEEGLVKLKKFDEAEIVKKKREQQGEEDLIRSTKILEKSLACEEKKLKQIQNNGLLYLQKRFQKEFDELNRARERDLDTLNKKYSNKNNELNIQQKYENMYNFSDTYERRGGSGLEKNFEQKMKIKRGGEKKINKTLEIGRMFGEVKDKKNENEKSAVEVDKSNKNLGAEEGMSEKDNVNQGEIDLSHNEEGEVFNNNMDNMGYGEDFQAEGEENEEQYA